MPQHVSHPLVSLNLKTGAWTGPSGIQYDSYREGVIEEAFNLCGCGHTSERDALLVTLFSKIGSGTEAVQAARDAVTGQPEIAAEILMHWLDDAGFLEHGFSVLTSWSVHQGDVLAQGSDLRGFLSGLKASSLAQGVLEGFSRGQAQTDTETKTFYDGFTAWVRDTPVAAAQVLLAFCIERGLLELGEIMTLTDKGRIIFGLNEGADVS